jgi:regulator of sigma E protease
MKEFFMNVLASAVGVSQSLFFGIAGLFGIGFVIGFHELGHFLFCKLFKVSTPSFSIGFGPRLITKKIGDTEFALSAIPLGGYVEIAGAAEVGQGEQKEAARTDEHSFSSKPFYQKFAIMFGGILFNTAFAYAIFILLFMVGIPKSMILYPKNATPIIEIIKPGSAAEKAGLKVNDTILTINGRALNDDATSFIKEIQSMPGQQVALRIQRDQQLQELTVTPEAMTSLGKQVGTLGVIFQTQPLEGLPVLTAIKEGIRVVNAQIYNTIMTIMHVFSKGDTSLVVGPVMLISETAKGAQSGFKTFLLFLAFISISLAVMNLLPLPILDGGQIVFYSIEAIIGRPIPIKVREYIHIACWVALLALVLYLSAKDLRQLLSPYIDAVLGFVGYGN